MKIDKTKLNLIIMQGVPGSGKSYAAREIMSTNYSPNEIDRSACIVSTDEFWCLETGKYAFDMSKLGQAHTWNRGRAYQAMRLNIPLVIIDNTNISAKEYNPYIKDGKKFGYEHQIVRSSAPWANDAEECFKRNTHGVPLEVIQNMLQRLNNGKKVEVSKEAVEIAKSEDKTVCFQCESPLKVDSLDFVGSHHWYVCTNLQCGVRFYLNPITVTL